KKAVDLARIDRFSEVCRLSGTHAWQSRVECEAHDDGAAGSNEIASFHRRLLCLRRAQHGGKNSSIGCASAQITAEALLHLFGGWVRRLTEKRLRRHDHSIRAVP